MIHDASLLCIIKLFYFEQYYYIAICFFCQHSRLWINCELFVEPCKTICLTELILTRKIPYTIMKSEKSIEIGTQGQELGGTPKQGRCRVSPQCTQEQSCHWIFFREGVCRPCLLAGDQSEYLPVFSPLGNCLKSAVLWNLNKDANQPVAFS